MLGWLARLWTGERPFTLLIYMRSGNVIRCDRVTSFKWQEQGASRSLSIEQKEGGHSVLVKTIDLAQIEAVSRVD